MREKTAQNILLGAMAAIALFSFFGFAYADDSTEELRQKIEQKSEEIKKLEEEAKRYRNEIASTQNASKTLQEELKRTDQTIAQLQREITLTQRKMEKTSFEIDRLGLEIKSKQVSIQKMRSGLAGLIQVFSEQDQKSLLNIMLQNNALSDFLHQVESFSTLEEKIIDGLEDLRDLKYDLETKKTEAEGKKNELKSFDESLRDRRKVQEVARKERSGILKITKNQEKLYQDLLRETEKKQEAILKDIEELEEALRKQVDPGSLPEKRKGFLAWPAEGLLSQGYGETPFTRSARGRHFYKFHNGIDISAAFGSPIRAADDGKVLAVGDTDKYCYRGAYGKYIVIDHKNNLATMYAHLSLVKVANGQELKKGDIIGYMGNSGLSTGPHLHFTLYDARTVEIRLGSIGTCGLLPFGGSLNPLLYL